MDISLSFNKVTTSFCIFIFLDRCDDVPIAVLRSTRLIQPPPAFRKSVSSSRLQNKLRKLLVSDSMEKVSDDEADADKTSVARHEVSLYSYLFFCFFLIEEIRDITANFATEQPSQMSMCSRLSTC